MNIYVAREGSEVPVGEPLAPETGYEVVCNVGAPDPRSLLTPETGSAFPGEMLPSDAPELQAVLYVRGAPAGRAVRLQVPARGDSPWIRLPLPGQPAGTAVHAELTLYYGVVAVHVTAITVPVGGPPGRGRPTAKALYKLSRSFSGLGRLASRRLSVLVSGEPTSPALQVNGMSFAPNSISVEAKAVDDAVFAARKHLYRMQFGEGPVSRYSGSYGKSYDALVADLRVLANLGARLYDNLFPRPDVYTTMAELVRMEAASHVRPPILQVVGLGERPAPIPWAVLYDLPLGGVPSRYKPCRSIAEYGPGAPGSSAPARCPYEADHRDGDRWKPDQLCPWGFWGLSSIIEHPPYVEGRDLEHVVEDGGGGLPVSVLAVDSSDGLDLGLTRRHFDALTTRLGEAIIRPAITTLEGLCAELAGETMDVVYMYSHCGYDMAADGVGYDLYLRMYGDTLTPADVNQWTRTSGWPDPHWPRRHPLVILNGCHTTETVTGTFSSFVRSFANRAQASGVIGTEITMEQGLAGWAMELFLTEFVHGATVGEALRDTRWRMFARGNLMGLAYTPHCLAELTLRRALRMESPWY
ncbi:hypothetical protein [Sphaerisporangium dianthi]|uniref:CHAT domain-containing protein n=1 Tax=Sphaerisporangium dianthi TaxID=1436120 RepID=A0ABV9CGW3_9ACTN